MAVFRLFVLRSAGGEKVPVSVAKETEADLAAHSCGPVADRLDV